MGLVVVKELGLGLNSRRRRPGQRETTTTTRPGRILIFHEPEFSIFRNKISFPGSTLRLNINQLRLYDLLVPHDFIKILMKSRSDMLSVQSK